jgi:hypothetical protein
VLRHGTSISGQAIVWNYPSRATRATLPNKITLAGHHSMADSPTVDSRGHGLDAEIPISKTAMRFCGRWGTLFDPLSPSILSLRLVTSVNINEELQEANLRPYYRACLREERARVAQDVERLAIDSFTEISQSSVRVRPERAAIRIASALLIAGHSPRFLATRTRSWELLLGKTPPTAGHPDVALESNPSPETFFSLERWKAMYPVQLYTCYFMARYLRNFAAGIDPRLGHWTLATLPAELRDAIVGRVDGKSREYTESGLAIQVEAVDANDAVERSLTLLDQLTLQVRFMKAQKSRTIDVRRDVMTTVVVASSDSPPIRFRYRTLNFRHKRLEVRDGASAFKLRSLIRQSASFSAMFRAYANALEVAKLESDHQSLAPPRNAFYIYLHLTTGLDSIFSEASKFLYPDEDYQPSLLVAIGARMMALDSLRQVLIAIRDGLMVKKNSEVDVKSLMAGDLRKIGDHFVLKMGAKRDLARVMSMAYFLQHNWGQNFNLFLRQSATRYYHDLLRCIMRRNSLIHENEEGVNYNLVKVLFELYRLIISFRVSLHRGAESEGSPSGLGSEEDVVFAKMILCQMYDFNALAYGRGAPFGVDRFFREHLVREGWASWTRRNPLDHFDNDFAELIAKCRAEFPTAGALQKFDKEPGLML